MTSLFSRAKFLCRSRRFRFSSLASAEGSPTSLSHEEAEAILQSVLTFTKFGLPGRKLDEISLITSANVQSKWQSMMEIRIQTELHVINAFGFESSQHGMVAYRQTMAHRMQQGATGETTALQSLDKQIWSELIRRSFNISPTGDLTLPQARQVIFMVASKLQQSDFLKTLKTAIDLLGSDASDVQKHTRMQESILGVWLEVLPSFGFEGEKGYVVFQAGLVDHSADPEIATIMQAALMTLGVHTGLSR